LHGRLPGLRGLGGGSENHGAAHGAADTRRVSWGFHGGIPWIFLLVKKIQTYLDNGNFMVHVFFLKNCG